MHEFECYIYVKTWMDERIDESVFWWLSHIEKWRIVVFLKGDTKGSVLEVIQWVICEKGGLVQ